ncbi:hypothetical protein A1O3_03673 [Capronia epimyces CBS 606.96]|uniref:Uncharacterized protein n=1 Tax=Capronia epimyces CBS 606.96 TaxID=1182542 RepID=W9YAN7_9EURO|nr:uncharacterized protein A1O3_03673 [Capronia epimyces CBS 606.96]EXJ86720.1 hypothetical protein A1O3_03673 [Capronia epimyces CBS 606.96]
MQTIQEEAGEVDLTAPSTSSDPAPEIGENSLEHSNQDKDNIAPEIAEYVEKIRAAIKMQAESLKVQKTNMRGPEEQEGKLACQSRVGRKYKRSSFILLRDKARNNMSNVKLRGKRMSKLSNAEIPKQERRSRGGPDLDTNSVNARP